MKNIYLSLCTLLISVFSLNAQEVVEATFLQTYDVSFFQDELEIPFSKYGVDLYRILYTTTDLEGQLDTASGLLVIPIIDELNLPFLVYCHGTSSDRFDVPGYLSFEHQLPALYSSLGVVSIAPDYLGLGYNKGIHPYVHAESEASASYDMMVAVQNFLPTMTDAKLNDELLITGYSQGGHAAMALHRLLQDEKDIAVTASYPMSGPYSLSTGMKDLLSSEEEYANVAYLVATSISYQEVYGDIYPDGDIAKFFKPAYLSLVIQFQNEELSLIELNDNLIQILTQLEGGAFPSKMIFDDIVEATLSDDNHPILANLRKNDVFDWAPQGNTRLLYCEGDEQVPFINSIIAEEKMTANGAPDVEAANLDSSLDHFGCVTPAATTFVFYLLAFSGPTSTQWAPQIDLMIYPNPTSEHMTVTFDNTQHENINISIYNPSGELVSQKNAIQDKQYIQLGLSSGLYLIQFTGNDGVSLGYEKLVIKR